MTSTKIEGTVVRVGNYVGFKCDIEQSGVITRIYKSYDGINLDLKNDEGFQGGYIGGTNAHTVLAEDCWVD